MADTQSRFSCKCNNSYLINYKNVCLKLVSLIVLCSIHNVYGNGTQLEDTVAYQYENGDIVDLTSLGFRTDKAWWLYMNLADDDVQLSYNPCSPFNVDRKCQDAAACMATQDGAINIGFAETATFNETDGKLYLLYLNCHDNITSGSLQLGMVKMELTCDDTLTQDPSVEVIGNISDDIYGMILSSKCCCRNVCAGDIVDPTTLVPNNTDPTIGLQTLGTDPETLPPIITQVTHNTAGTLPPIITQVTHHTAGTLPPIITQVTHHTAGTVPPSPSKKLSAGSVLCIIFVCFAAAYLICGAIYMKLFVGASGKEIMPNIRFWEDLPNLVLDGFMFCFSPCQKGVGSNQYEDI